MGLYPVTAATQVNVNDGWWSTKPDRTRSQNADEAKGVRIAAALVPAFSCHDVDTFRYPHSNEKDPPP